MKNELDSKFLLQVFDKIRQHGDKEDEQYKLMGITAFTDYDGYTLFIEDVNVKLQFGFHNQYRFDYTSADHYVSFEKKLEADRQHILKLVYNFSFDLKKSAPSLSSVSLKSLRRSTLM